MFPVNTGTPERRIVERHVVALNAESQRYLIANEVLQVGLTMSTDLPIWKVCFANCKAAIKIYLTHIQRARRSKSLLELANTFDAAFHADYISILCSDDAFVFLCMPAIGGLKQV